MTEIVLLSLLTWGLHFLCFIELRFHLKESDTEGTMLFVRTRTGKGFVNMCTEW